jgi:hypothetical protein
MKNTTLLISGTSDYGYKLLWRDAGQEYHHLWPWLAHYSPELRFKE